MREIKFRGKRKDNGEWVYGDFAYIAVPGLGLALATGCNAGFPEDVEPCIVTVKKRQHPYFSDSGPLEIVENEYHVVDIETVGQYTGRKDKNGTAEIYSGDLVRVVVGNNEHTAKVVFNQKTCGFEIWYTTTVGAYGEKATHKINFAQYDEIEKIGNVHDNPELLERRG